MINIKVYQENIPENVTSALKNVLRHWIMRKEGKYVKIVNFVDNY